MNILVKRIYFLQVKAANVINFLKERRNKISKQIDGDRLANS